MHDDQQCNAERLSRRDWLKTGTLAAASLAVAPRHASAADHHESTKNMHLSLAAYSMREALTDGDMTLFDFIDWCGELGLAGTELTSYYFRETIDDAYLHALRRRALRNGVTISGTAIRNDFCRPPGPEKQEDIEHVKQWIDYAATLFAPHIRIFAGTLPDGVDKQTGIQWVADGIKEVLGYAAQRGILIGLENHGGITARAADHLAICDAVGDHPWFGINLDTGNYRTNAYEELAMAAPRAVNVQVKAEVTRNDGTTEPTDYARIRDILVEADYKGWVALEYEEENPEAEIPKHVEELQELFA
jgi:sugar phosphate isomerase/epimerase